MTNLFLFIYIYSVCYLQSIVQERKNNNPGGDSEVSWFQS